MFFFLFDNIPHYKQWTMCVGTAVKPIETFIVRVSLTVTTSLGRRVTLPLSLSPFQRARPGSRPIVGDTWEPKSRHGAVLNDGVGVSNTTRIAVETNITPETTGVGGRRRNGTGKTLLIRNVVKEREKKKKNVRDKMTTAVWKALWLFVNARREACDIM